MTGAPRPSREINTKGFTLHHPLARRKYSIDYYQRECKWQPRQIAKLNWDLERLTRKTAS